MMPQALSSSGTYNSVAVWFRLHLACGTCLVAPAATATASGLWHVSSPHCMVCEVYMFMQEKSQVKSSETGILVYETGSEYTSNQGDSGATTCTTCTVQKLSLIHI